jgi:hypothetical protein
MAYNRLFIFDPKSGNAVCIGKGYASGWSTGLKPYIDKWMDANPEYNPDVTRMELRTENDLPEGTNITWEPDIKTRDR